MLEGDGGHRECCHSARRGRGSGCEESGAQTTAPPQRTEKRGMGHACFVIRTELPPTALASPFGAPLGGPSGHRRQLA